MYESYSHADYHIAASPGLGLPAAEYLYSYTKAINGGYNVTFNQDPELIDTPNWVPLPLNKIVIGLANGWADGEKAVIISSDDCRSAYEMMVEGLGGGVRGFMFWDIADEGLNDVFLAKGLNEILEIRS